MTEMDRAWGAANNLLDLLEPVRPYLDDPTLTNLHINGTVAAFAHRDGRKEQIALSYSHDDLVDIAINAAALNRGDDVDDTAPFAGGTLPGDYRVQVARSPATADGFLALSIRKPTARTRTLAELRDQGAFRRTVGGSAPRVGRRRPELMDLYRSDNHFAFLDAACAAGLNIAFGGPQDVGKSSVLRSATTSLPLDKRVVTVEDMAEAINLHQPDVVPLYYSKGGQGTSRHTADDCIAAALRMASQVLVIQELRDGSAFSALSALMAGIQVFFTAHANSAEDLFDRVRSMVKMHPMGVHRGDADVLADLYATLDVVVFCEKVGTEYSVAQVLYDPERSDRYADRVKAKLEAT